MKVGLKLWSSNPAKVVEESKFADFVEVLPVDMKSLAKFAKYDYEYTVHVPHEYFGFSPLMDYKKSLKLVKRTTEAAKKLKAGWMVMHTGRIKGKPTENAINAAAKAIAKLAKEARYDKTILENSIVNEIRKGEEISYVGYNYEQMKQLLEESGVGFCLDLEHAAIAAHQLGLDYEKLVASLMKLKPDYFHLSGTKPDKYGPYGHHLSIFDSDIDNDFVKKTIQKANKPVCLETPIDTAQRRKEYEFLKS